MIIYSTRNGNLQATIVQLLLFVAKKRYFANTQAKEKYMLVFVWPLHKTVWKTKK